MAITLLRHTKPDIADGICYGRTDLELASSFQSEAENVASSLPVFDHIVTSPLRRCRLLAEHLGKTLNSEVTIDERVIEMDFGDWEAVAWNDIPRAQLDEWADDFYHACPHGGETVAALKARVDTAVADISALDRKTLIVTHAGVMKAILAKGKQARDYNRQFDFGEHIKLIEG